MADTDPWWRRWDRWTMTAAYFLWGGRYRQEFERWWARREQSQRRAWQDTCCYSDLEQAEEA